MIPRSPADVPGTAGIPELARSWVDHALALTFHRLYLLDREDVIAHALAGLAIGHALTEAVTGSRVMTSVQALEHGATLAEVAEAQATDPEGLRIELTSWADGQHRFGFIDDERRDAVLALIGVSP